MDYSLILTKYTLAQILEFNDLSDEDVLRELDNNCPLHWPTMPVD
jgi:hypothetical protein